MFCKYRVVLSVDGCGFKGIIPLKILSYLHQMIQENNPDMDVTSYIDLFTSTSASSIFTGALMLKDKQGRTVYHPEDLLQFYLNKGERMFSEKIGVDAANSTYPLSFVLNHFFGSVYLKDLQNHFLFYSFNQIQESILTFSKFNDRFYNLPLSTVMQACTVDGVNFPPLKLGETSLIDASSHIKNPAFLGYNYMRLLYPKNQLVLISIGTKDQNLPNVHQQDVHHILLSKSKEDPFFKYFRYELELPSSLSNSESYENVDLLLKLTEKYIENNQVNFEELIKLVLLRVA